MKHKNLSRYVKKKYIFSYMLVMFLLFLLSEPAVAAEGARFGLMLWANRLLPSLLPFMILSQLLMRSGYLDAITRRLRITYPYFVLFAGTLFGFPMGAKLTVDLYEQQKLSKEEASVLFIAANQMSPAFVGGYILSETLQMPRLIPTTYLILYAPSVCYTVIRLHIQKKHARAKWLSSFESKKSTSGLQMNVAVLDAGIMNSFETMLKLGGYVMLFSVLTAMCRHFLDFFPAVCTIIAAMLEVTGAVSAINNFFSSTYLKYVALLAATAFGGCSGIAQTASIIRLGKHTSALSIKKYICGRLLVSAVTAFLAAMIYPYL